MSSTYVVELEDFSSRPEQIDLKPQRPASIKSTSRRSNRSNESTKDIHGTLPSPTTAAIETQERWNHPQINMYRTFATFWSFIVLGANDAALGVCLAILRKRLC
jgi:hypothetical protein